MIRTLPYSEEAERGLLGCILKDAQRVLDLCIEARMLAEWFYLPMHRTIAEVAIRLHVAAQAVDLITVTAALSDAGQLDAIGGHACLDRIMDDCGTPEHAGHYLAIVTEKAHLRRIIETCRKIEADATGPDAKPTEIGSRAEYAFAQIDGTGEEIKQPKDVLIEQITLWEQAQESGCVGVQTGYRVIDRFFGGLMEGALYYLSGMPGAGKTTFARNIAENVARRGHPVWFWSLEQTGGQVWGSIAATEAKESVFFLNQGNPRASVRNVFDAATRVMRLPITIDDRGQSPATLWTSARKAVTKHGCKLFILDYLQALREDSRHESDVIRQTQHSNAVRDIAKTLRVPVLVISALSNEGRLRGSGMLGYDAWAHIKLEQAEDFPQTGRVRVSFEKQRFGPLVGDEELILIGNEQRFVEPNGIDDYMSEEWGR